MLIAVSFSKAEAACLHGFQLHVRPETSILRPYPVSHLRMRCQRWIRLPQKDMGDYLTFKRTKCEESLDENGYSRLLKLRYATFMGHEEKDPILIDLSLDCGTTLPPERIEPASRVYVEGLETCKYLVYPLPDQLADKLCAIMERQPGGWHSSRMKDLVDIVFYATNESFCLSSSHTQSNASACGAGWLFRNGSPHRGTGRLRLLGLRREMESIQSMHLSRVHAASLRISSILPCQAQTAMSAYHGTP